MKYIIAFILFFASSNSLFAQNSYIQITGEPNLSVYLNGQYKGKTSTEYNGYIIENVAAGANKIKIVKDGYAAFEETITVKSGEVFAYKVKPFIKHTVTISEQGNSGATEKKASIATGKLIIQSVPIEIKITIPAIEGIKNITKTKDEWIVNDIPEGKYDVELSFGGRTFKKNIEIFSGNTTSAFINMMSGELKVRTPLDDQREKYETIQYFNKIADRLGFKSKLTAKQFFAQNPVASKLSTHNIGNGFYHLPDRILLKNTELTPGPRQLTVNKGYVDSYVYCLSSYEDQNSASRECRVLIDKIKRETSPKYADFKTSVSGFYPIDTKMVYVYDVAKVTENRYEVRLTIYDHSNL